MKTFMERRNAQIEIESDLEAVDPGQLVEIPVEKLFTAFGKPDKAGCFHWPQDSDDDDD